MPQCHFCTEPLDENLVCEACGAVYEYTPGDVDKYVVPRGGPPSGEYQPDAPAKDDARRSLEPARRVQFDEETCRNNDS